MIITPNIRLSRTLKVTWKTDLFIILSCTLAYFANEYLFREYFDVPPIIATVLGTALAFFIGFNNNQSYDRWWEARKIWGKMVNDSRSWARGVLYYCTATDSADEAYLAQRKKVMLHRHIAFLYALKANLRKDKNDRTYEKYLSEEELTEVTQESNLHNAILSRQSADLEQLYRQGFVDGFRFMSLNDMIVGFCDEMGKSERIRNTVFPTSYNYFTRLFIWIFVICLTIVTSNMVGAWSIFFGFLIGFVFHTTHTIGMKLLNPFDPVSTGIPLNQITRTIEINLLEMMKEQEIPEPVKAINGEYIM